MKGRAYFVDVKKVDALQAVGMKQAKNLGNGVLYG